MSSAYTSHSERAVSVMRGASFSSFTGPGASAFESCMPPTPSSGITPTATTMTARPPSQMSEWRQKLIEGASGSSPSSTVDPVVVSPDIVSKKARVKLSPGSVKMSGSAAMRPDRDPAERHQEEAVARLELPAMAVGRGGKHRAGGHRDRGGSRNRSQRPSPVASEHPIGRM